MEKERDTKTSLLNFIERAKYNFSPLQSTDTFVSLKQIKEAQKQKKVTKKIIEVCVGLIHL
jgi:hypothetical protein